MCCVAVFAVQIMLYGTGAALNGTATASQFDYIKQGVAYRCVRPSLSLPSRIGQQTAADVNSASV
jgi:hypothetical protein